MGTSVPARAHLESHRAWRPEWAVERVCVYWYLSLGDAVAGTFHPDGHEVVRRARWLDAVPTRWLHVTLCDVGFTDELTPDAVQRVTEVGRACADETGQLQLTFGPGTTMEDAVVLPVGPVGELARLQQRLRGETQRTLGPTHRLSHDQVFWPHLSLGYANRRVTARTATALLQRLGQVLDEVPVDRLVLAAVSRVHGHYRWTVLEELPLGARVTVALPG